MNRFHVHVNVTDLERSMAFYTQLFGAAPSVVKSDYAKWMLDDPRVNFAISKRDRAAGVDHLGIQADDGAALEAIGARLKAADAVSLAEVGTTCCYAHSDKHWTEDPQGLRWETFHTHGDATTYFAPQTATSAVPAPTTAASSGCAAGAKPAAAACCAPAETGSAGGCCN
ncbi:MAG TPA: ArsI/CadI family heavy metal resistance metalloenzyme [Nevskia sp.]|nr:ArsI/CadI family heavy metal resistance metalloenzyme [Nevskia sp.]